MLSALLGTVFDFFKMSLTSFVEIIGVLLSYTGIAFTLLLFVVSILYYLIKYKVLKKILNECMLGNYDFVIKRAARLHKIYYSIFRILPTPAIRGNVEYLSKVLSMAYLATNDENNFLKHIHILKKDKTFKELWLSLYYLLKDDTESAMPHYEHLKALPTAPASLGLLDGIILAKQGKTDEAQDKFEEVYPKLNYAFTKEIAARFMQS